MASKNVNTVMYNQQIQLIQSLPNSTVDILGVGPYGIIDASNANATVYTNQAAPAIVIPTTDPLVKYSIWYNTTASAIQISTQAT